MTSPRVSPVVCLLTLALACGGGDDGRETSATETPTNPTIPGGTTTGTSGPDATLTDAIPTSGSVGETPGETPAEMTTTTGPIDPSTTTTGPVDPTTTTGPIDPSTTMGPDPTMEPPPPECSTVLQATVRDFSVGHPDFEDYLGEQKGLVLADLGPDKKPVYAHPGATPVTTGPGEFSQWYNDVGGVNQPFPIEIPLTEVMPGLYSYDNSAFFPVDGQGFGNEGNAHNFHFTTEIHTEFTYQGGEVFTFTGDDDLFLFINGKLAIDLGGVHGAQSESVDLDASAAALGISVGGLYPMDIFHAERHTSESNFRVDTSIACFIMPG